MGEPEPETITLFGQTNFRNKKVKFGIKTDDRRRHLYTIGKTGMGKSQLLENMMISDIRNGYGACMIDPHGDMVENIIQCVPRNRVDDIIYFNPADVEHPIAFNVFEKVDVKYRPLVASGVVGVFKKIWADSWGPRLEYILNNCILALLEAPDSTLLGVMRILTDRKYREQVVREVTDPMIKYFWTREFSKYPDKEIAMIISPIQNKVGQYLSNAMIRNVVGQPISTINLRQIMDERKVLLLNLSKGRIGEDASALLGALMITKIQLAAMSRVDIVEKNREDFYLYVDELQNFATDSFAGILSEARKYHLNLTMAHQYIEQLPETLQAAVFGNVGTMISFRVGANDAEYLAKEFAPTFIEEDFVNLPKYHIYLKLMIDGVASQGFSANTLPPIAKPEGFEQMVIENSRKKYSRPVELVEQEFLKWWNLNDQSVPAVEEKPVLVEEKKTDEDEVRLADMSETVKDQVAKMIKQNQNEREERQHEKVSKIEPKKSENIPEVKISVSVKNETVPEKKMSVAVEQSKVQSETETETENPRVLKTVIFDEVKANSAVDDGKFNYDAVDWYNIEKKSKELSFDGQYVCDVCDAQMYLDFAPRLDKPILCQKCVKKRDKFMKRIKREREEEKALGLAEREAARRLAPVEQKVTADYSQKPPRYTEDRSSDNSGENYRNDRSATRNDTHASLASKKGRNWGMMKNNTNSNVSRPPHHSKPMDVKPASKVTFDNTNFDDDLKDLYGTKDSRALDNNNAPRKPRPDLPPATIRIVGKPVVPATNVAKSRDGFAPAGLAMTGKPATNVAKTDKPAMNVTAQPLVEDKKVTHEHLHTHYHVHADKPATNVANADKPVTKVASPSASPKPAFKPFDDEPILATKSGMKDLAPGEEVNFAKDDK